MNVNFGDLYDNYVGMYKIQKYWLRIKNWFHESISQLKFLHNVPVKEIDTKDEQEWEKEKSAAPRSYEQTK